VTADAATRLPKQDNEPHDSASHARLRADDDRWNALALIGLQDCFGLRGPDDVIEMRNCTCGTTLGRRTRRTELKFEVYRDKADEYRWRLLAANGRLTADSGEGYTRREDVHRAIAALLMGINDVAIVNA